MTSDKASGEDREVPESTSDNSQPVLTPPRRGRQPGLLPTRYAGQMAKATMLDDDTRRAYTSRTRGYLAWLAAADVDGDGA